MQYLLIASNYDGTLAKDGTADRLLQSGRKLFLVTGRQLDDLKTVFPKIHRCALVVGRKRRATVQPKNSRRTLLGRTSESGVPGRADPKRSSFFGRSGRRGHVGTESEPMFGAIQHPGLELQVSFNKVSVMVLPSGINKRTGLEAALAQLSLSQHDIAGIYRLTTSRVFFTRANCFLNRKAIGCSARRTANRRASFEENPVEMALLDYLMPDIDGGVVAGEIRRQRPCISIIIVFGQSMAHELCNDVDYVLLEGEGPTVLLNKMNQLMRSAK